MVLDVPNDTEYYSTNTTRLDIIPRTNNHFVRAQSNSQLIDEELIGIIEYSTTYIECILQPYTERRSHNKVYKTLINFRTKSHLTFFLS